MSVIGDITAFANPFGTPAKGKWNLTPGTWTPLGSTEPIIFYAQTRAGDQNGQLTAVDSITDSGSRRLAIYEYPYVDGQKIRDMGRKAETYSFNIKFFGPNYQAKYREFYSKVYQSNSYGTLKHPVLSAIRGDCLTRLQTFEQIHRAEESNSVTIRAVFIEDNTGKIEAALADAKPDVDTALQSSLKSLVQRSALISQNLSIAAAALQLPSALIAGLQTRANSIVGQVSGILGSLGASFSLSNQLANVFAIASGTGGGVPNQSFGTVVQRTSTGATQVTKISPVYQVALDPNSQTLVQNQIASFTESSQVTPAQAVYQTNQARQAISQAIAEAESTLGNYAYDTVIQYRQMAVDIQETTEACVLAAQARVRLYQVPRHMSLRMIAFANGLSADRQNDIEQLNPYLGSVNLVPAGSTITVPAS